MMETLNKTIITKEEVVLCPICIQSVLDTDKAVLCDGHGTTLDAWV